MKIELIGLEIEVTNSRNPHLIGLKGKIVDETRNMLAISKNNEEIKLIKDQITIAADINNRKIAISCALLVGRPEERLKKKFKG